MTVGTAVAPKGGRSLRAADGFGRTVLITDDQGDGCDDLAVAATPGPICGSNSGALASFLTVPSIPLCQFRRLPTFILPTVTLSDTHTTGPMDPARSWPNSTQEVPGEAPQNGHRRW